MGGQANNQRKPAGYSGTPLLKKLGIKPGFRVLAINAPDHYWTLLGALPTDVEIKSRLSGIFEFIHIFVTSSSELKKRLPAIKKRLLSTGMVWISWPKKTSGMKSDLDGNVVRKLGLNTKLVDIKVCAVDETWSGLKFVIPVKDR